MYNFSLYNSKQLRSISNGVGLFVFFRSFFLSFARLFFFSFHYGVFWLVWFGFKIIIIIIIIIIMVAAAAAATAFAKYINFSPPPCMVL